LIGAACPIRAVLRGLRLPAGKQVGILTEIQTKVKEKTAKRLATGD
jgi:hypothetical protein